MGSKRIKELLDTEGFTEECFGCCYYTEDLEFNDQDCTCLRDELCMRVDTEIKAGDWCKLWHNYQKDAVIGKVEQIKSNGFSKYVFNFEVYMFAKRVSPELAALLEEEFSE